MTERSLTEEIPHQHIITELEVQLHAKTSELVVAMARVRTRDDRISALEQKISDLEKKLIDAMEDQYGPAA